MIYFLAEEVPTLGTKRLTDISEGYLKWKFSKEKEPKNGDKRGLYYEYKELPLELPLVCDIILTVHETSRMVTLYTAMLGTCKSDWIRKVHGWNSELNCFNVNT